MTRMYGHYGATVEISDSIGLVGGDDGIQIIEDSGSHGHMIDLNREDAIKVAAYILQRYRVPICLRYGQVKEDKAA